MAGRYPPRHDDTLTISVRVQARSKRSEIERLVSGCLHVRTTAPPTDGKANKDVIRQIAKAYKVPTSRVSLVRGARGRAKVFRIVGPYTEPGFAGNRDRSGKD